jgi:N-acetylglutamate synthase-like GNAT family acetyltransferase
MFVLRSATAADKYILQTLYSTVTGTSLSLTDEEWDRSISLDGLGAVEIVIAEKDGRTIGFGGVDVTAREQLRWLYLLPQYQRGGFGSKILQQLESVAWRSGLQSIRLHSTPNAVEFYSKRGYTRVQDHERFGHDHDGVEMVKVRQHSVSL